MLLRLAAGLAALWQAGAALAAFGNSRAGAWLIFVIAAVADISLLVGFLTPVGAAIAGIQTVCVAMWWLPANSNLVDAKLAAALIVSISAAITLLGPGAFSVDARLFGRREIIIPHGTRSAKD